MAGVHYTVRPKKNGTVALTPASWVRISDSFEIFQKFCCQFNFLRLNGVYSEVKWKEGNRTALFLQFLRSQERLDWLKRTKSVFTAYFCSVFFTVELWNCYMCKNEHGMSNKETFLYILFAVNVVYPKKNEQLAYFLIGRGGHDRHKFHVNKPNW